MGEGKLVEGHPTATKREIQPREQCRWVTEADVNKSNKESAKADKR